MSTNRQWILKSRPATLVGPENFEFVESAIPSIAHGQMLVRPLYFSMDPTQRGWLHEEDNYVEPVAIGAPMRAGGIGQVVESRMEGFAPGDLVNGTLSWSDYCVVDAGGFVPPRKIDQSVPLTWHISAFGITTLTAYFGITQVAQVKADDVVLISGAAGATGAACVQIARIKGAKTIIGIAGGPEKCAWLTNEGGCDAAIDYKSDDIAAKVAELAPDGIDVFYDNTGGPALDAALINMAEGARLAICGGISNGYNSWTVDNGPQNYMYLILKGARMQGFLVLHYMDQFPAAIGEISGWLQSGALKPHETVIEGLEKAPETLQGLFTGLNRGKLILKVGEPAN
ncbi:MAG: NADP-dependent oxidoreductase [Pseudomonadota bacterium]